jgi:hypothetical protein
MVDKRHSPCANSLLKQSLRPEPLSETLVKDHVEETPLEDSPVVIRTKDHEAVPMTLDQALYEMELVGHDFFLFIEADSGLPSVVYRRRGWNYGVIRLRAEEAATAEPLHSESVPVGS